MLMFLSFTIVSSFMIITQKEKCLVVYSISRKQLLQVMYYYREKLLQITLQGDTQMRSCRTLEKIIKVQKVEFHFVNNPHFKGTILLST